MVAKLAGVAVVLGRKRARARSIRVSLSVLVTILQQRTERRFATAQPQIMALSHFDADDQANAEYAKWLHHGQRVLATRNSGLTCLNAAENPPGAAGSLRSGLDGGGFLTVSVCGHGSSGTNAGIELADGHWCGEGCDWRAVNLLLLASCSVGRLEQTEDQDVEGLCVQLALHRARSVVACRWPVSTPQAIAFTNEVVARYLALRADGETGNLRARAVAATRRRFLDDHDERVDGGIARLVTVAAFELYGLG